MTTHNPYRPDLCEPGCIHDRCDYAGCLGPADGSECRHPRPDDDAPPRSWIEDAQWVIDTYGPTTEDVTVPPPRFTADEAREAFDAAHLAMHRAVKRIDR